MQSFHGDNFCTKTLCTNLFTGTVELTKIISAQLISHENVVQPRTKLIKQTRKQIDRITASIHHVPVIHGDTTFLGKIQHTRFLHPFNQRRMRLRSQIDQHSTTGLLDRTFNNRIQGLITIHNHRRCITGIVAHQRPMRTICIETNKKHLLIDKILSEQPGHQRFAHAPFFSTD